MGRHPTPQHNSHHHDFISSAPLYPNFNKISCQMPIDGFRGLICLWFSWHLHALARGDGLVSVPGDFKPNHHSARFDSTYTKPNHRKTSARSLLARCVQVGTPKVLVYGAPRLAIPQGLCAGVLTGFSLNCFHDNSKAVT